MTRRRIIATAGGSGIILSAGCIGDLAGDGGTESVDKNGEIDESVDSARKGNTLFGEILIEPTVPLVPSLAEYADAAENSAAPKDGIPAIDDPVATDAEEGVPSVTNESFVFGVEIEGEARAYPHNVLVWHEIVNDVLGGKPFSVTYCPLTGTAIGYERGDTVFGVEGWLINSNLILFDRQTDSWWPQVLGIAVDGDLKGYSLPEIRVVWTTWGSWRDVHPNTTIITEDTGYARDYLRDPYGSYDPPDGYYVSNSTVFPVMHVDDRLHPKHVVMGSRTADGAIAFDKDLLRDEGVLSSELNGIQYLAVYETNLDTAFVYRILENRRGTSDISESIVVDEDENGYVVGGATYPANDLPFDTVNVFDAMWFAWFAFYPDTVLVT